MRVMNLPEGGIKILAQGIAKAHVTEVLPGRGASKTKIEVARGGNSMQKKQIFRLKIFKV